MQRQTFTVVREIGGHGVGLEFHEEPWVGYHSKRGEEMLLVPGMIFTIEPMVNMGKRRYYNRFTKWLGSLYKRSYAIGTVGNYGACDRGRK